jgi:hypothetical protein
MEPLTIFALVIAFAYVVLYIRGRVYQREQFEDRPAKYTVLDTSYKAAPYVTTETSQGDFEQDFVYKQEGGFDPTREAIDAAKRKFPFDWAQLPPSSSLFQAQQALFVNDKGSTAAPFVAETYEAIEAKKVLPPDTTGKVTEEDLLKAYQPKATPDMKAVDQASVEELIQKLYGDKGLIAKVAKKANNVFEVYEVQEKNPKIVWEDEAQQASIQDNALNPLPDPSNTLLVPPSVGDVSAGVVPNVAGESMHLPRREYSDYNPNLEVMFGPKMQMQQYG